MKKLFPLLAILCIFINLNAQEAPSPILFIYDASGSMWGKMDNTTKKAIASEVLTTTLGNLAEEQQFGLIVYGHRKKGDCDDIEYAVDLSNQSKTKVTDIVSQLNPTGKTPLARSATMAFDALKKDQAKATIILITDGIESCDGDICKVVTEAKANGIDFKLHIVGFGLKDAEKEQLKCAAQAGNGQYYDADDATALSDVLIEVTAKTVDKPDVNFSIFAVKNGEPVDAWVRPQNSATKKDLNGVRTYRDTAQIYLPAGKYDIEIRPLENTKIPSTTITIEIEEGKPKHLDVSFDGGTLEVTTTNNGEPWDAVVRMYNKATGKLVANTRTYGKVKQIEVPAGHYKVNYEAIKLKGATRKAEVADVEIKANEVQPIAHDFKSGIAMIGVQTASGELIDATVNFYDKATSKHVTGSRTYTSEKTNPRQFRLSVGTYEVKIATVGAQKGNKKVLTVTIKEGETVEKIITF